MLLIRLPKPVLRVWFIKDLCVLFGKPQKTQRDVIFIVRVRLISDLVG